MSKRTTDEERIINFFETGHIEAVKSVFNMVKATMKRRMEAEDSFDVAVRSVPAPKKRKKRAPAAGSATAFPGVEAAAS